MDANAFLAQATRSDEQRPWHEVVLTCFDFVVCIVHGQRAQVDSLLGAVAVLNGQVQTLLRTNRTLSDRIAELEGRR